MRSHATRSFWAAYERLPAATRRLADKQIRLWRENPRHPSLRFRRVGRYWSARVSQEVRVLGVLDGDVVVWFWIGSHDEYERLVGSA